MSSDIPFLPGRGVEKIINLCVQAGHPEPEFIERTGGLCVILKSKQSIGAPIIYEAAAEMKLTDRQKEILNFIKQNKQATLLEIMEGLKHKSAKRTVQRDLSNLKNLGFIVLKGETKGSAWEIIAPNRA